MSGQGRDRLSERSGGVDEHFHLTQTTFTPDVIRNE
jgi:hypothetical protein